MAKFEKSVRRLLHIYGDNTAHVTPSVIMEMYKRIFGTLPASCVMEPKCQADDETNISRILQCLQDDVLNVDLSHIDAAKVAHGDPISGICI